ncbi:hypothetical protein B7463_g2686, partial [Scytalidium lignicola]
MVHGVPRNRRQWLQEMTNQNLLGPTIIIRSVRSRVSTALKIKKEQTEQPISQLAKRVEETNLSLPDKLHKSKPEQQTAESLSAQIRLGPRRTISIRDIRHDRSRHSYILPSRPRTTRTQNASNMEQPQGEVPVAEGRRSNDLEREEIVRMVATMLQQERDNAHRNDENNNRTPQESPSVEDDVLPNVRSRSLKPDDVSYFNPESDQEESSSSKLIYSDLYIFTDRLGHLSTIYGEQKVKEVFATYLRGSAALWHTTPNVSSQTFVESI